MAVKEVRSDFFPIRKDGWGVYVKPPDQVLVVEGEGQVGFGSDVLFGLMGWMGRQGWITKKADESIDISPNDKQYHDLVMGQKADLEAKIKQGLAQAATAVGDFELLLHDERKLKEYLDYFVAIRKAEEVYEEAKKKNEKKDIEKAMTILKNAEIQVKSIFIDQVDAHNGNSALNQAVQRWPTIIVDFQTITKYDLDEKGENESSQKIASRLGVSKAEGLVLAVKQKLYEEWKKLFFDNIKNRYERVKGLVEGRRKSVEQYREWIKPHIAKHKMIQESFSDPSAASGMNQVPFWTAGTAATSQSIRVWCYKRLQQIDYHKLSRQRLAGEFYVEPFDHLVIAACFGGNSGSKFSYKGYKVKVKYDVNGYVTDVDYDLDKNGNKQLENPDGDMNSLLMEYPGLTPKEIFNWWKDGIKKESLKTMSSDDKDKTKWGPMDPDILYYNFIDLSLDRFIMKGPTGQGENPQFTIKNYFMSQNMLLIKLLELRAQEWDFQNHVNELLGLSGKEGTSIQDIIKREYPHLYAEKPSGGSDSSAAKSSILSGIVKPFKDIIAYLPVPVKDTFSSLGFEIRSFLYKFGIDTENSRARGVPWGGKPAWSPRKPGPYESEFKDRVTTTYLKLIGGESGAVKGQLQTMLGM